MIGLEPVSISERKALEQLALNLDTDDIYDDDPARVFHLLVTVFRHYVDISGATPDENPIQREHTAYGALEALMENLDMDPDLL